MFCQNHSREDHRPPPPPEADMLCLMGPKPLSPYRPIPQPHLLMSDNSLRTNRSTVDKQGSRVLSLSAICLCLPLSHTHTHTHTDTHRHTQTHTDTHTNNACYAVSEPAGVELQRLVPLQNVPSWLRTGWLDQTDPDTRTHTHNKDTHTH